MPLLVSREERSVVADAMIENPTTYTAFGMRSPAAERRAAGTSVAPWSIGMECLSEAA